MTVFQSIGSWRAYRRIHHFPVLSFCSYHLSSSQDVVKYSFFSFILSSSENMKKESLTGIITQLVISVFNLFGLLKFCAALNPM